MVVVAEVKDEVDVVAVGSFLCYLWSTWHLGTVVNCKCRDRGTAGLVSSAEYGTVRGRVK